MPNPVLDHMDDLARRMRLSRWSPKQEQAPAESPPPGAAPQPTEPAPEDQDALLAYYDEAMK